MAVLMQMYSRNVTGVSMAIVLIEEGALGVDDLIGDYDFPPFPDTGPGGADDPPVSRERKS